MKTTIKCSCGCTVEIEHERTFELDAARKRPCAACRAAVRGGYDAAARAEKIAQYVAAGDNATRAAYEADMWIQAQRSARGAS